ncbi:ABC transporter type 1, transmembrane domain containing protein [Parasponia andersonii]|uniref:ABC transporter type 1, transmembrane domain containing protein n=1 Tax=Parasponia andersonii TaxID=3476 RepID=A0A2P5B3U4_PARAD|nr:ABC transporter type 1, transmembrane domain containing protein [Parasponia andersonii]
MDFVLCKKHVSLPIQSLVSDLVSLFLGLFFTYVGFFRKKEGEDTIFEEPLLNGNSTSVDSDVVSNKSTGDATVTPYANAGFFSIVTFSWIALLISTGNKKTLDLKDIPQLDARDSVAVIFPNLRNFIESEYGSINRVTSFKLVKALIFSVWREIFWTSLFVLLYSLASFVGLYLIDTFVQYLNGRREFKSEGYILVSAFCIAKLVKCLSHRQWFFWTRLLGVRLQAGLVVIICNKGLTLSCQSKQGHTNGEIINFI